MRAHRTVHGACSSQTSNNDDEEHEEFQKWGKHLMGIVMMMTRHEDKIQIIRYSASAYADMSHGLAHGLTHGSSPSLAYLGTHSLPVL